jgi:hydrogenase maturation protease
MTQLAAATRPQAATESSATVRVVVLGLGNPVLGDDAVGLHVAAEVERLQRENPVDGVTVLTSTRAGFELIDLLAGFTHAVVVDCLEVPDPTPGRVRRLNLTDVRGSARLVGAHEIGLADAFEFARMLGIEMPRTVEILTVDGGNTHTLSEEMTQPVIAAVATLARAVHARVGEWVRGFHPTAGAGEVATH